MGRRELFGYHIAWEWTFCGIRKNDCWELPWGGDQQVVKLSKGLCTLWNSDRSREGDGHWCWWKRKRRKDEESRNYGLFVCWIWHSVQIIMYCHRSHKLVLQPATTQRKMNLATRVKLPRRHDEQKSPGVPKKTARQGPNKVKKLYIYKF